MKDVADPDDGSETKVLAYATDTWSTQSIPLSSFAGLDRSSVYVLVEFVFSGGAARTIEFRNIRLLCEP